MKTSGVRKVRPALIPSGLPPAPRLRAPTSPYTPIAYVPRKIPRGSMPFKIYQGAADTTTPVSLTKRERAALCAAGSAVDYQEFPGLDHEAVVGQAAKVLPAWFEERFSGRAAASNCGAP